MNTEIRKGGKITKNYIAMREKNGIYVNDNNLCANIQKKKKKWQNILRVCLDRTYFAETENWKHCSKIIFKLWIVLWDPFLMKKLIKNEICGSVNRAWRRVKSCGYCSYTVYELIKLRIVKLSNRGSKRTLNIRVYDKQQYQW